MPPGRACSKTRSETPPCRCVEIPRPPVEERLHPQRLEEGERGSEREFVGRLRVAEEHRRVADRDLVRLDDAVVVEILVRVRERPVAAQRIARSELLRVAGVAGVET